jgi:hypothetical protein
VGGQGRQTAIVRLGRGGDGGAVGRGSYVRTSPRTFTVNSTANTATGGCNATQYTLTEAVNEANGNGESDTINAAASLSGRIDLRNTPSQGGFSILNDAPAMDLTIHGSGARALAVNGNDETRAFGIAPGANAAIKSLVIKNGRATGIDGGIYNTGTLALTNSTASSSTTNGQGGGILNGGSPGVPVLPTNTIIAGNTAGTPMRVVRSAVKAITRSATPVAQRGGTPRIC